MANKPDFFDVAIIGAGVAGLYASYCAGISGLNSCIIDSLMCPGGQCSVLYPDKKVYGVPGFEDATAGEFIEKLSNQALSLTAKTFFGQKVEFIAKLPSEVFQIKSRGFDILSRHLIIASGIGDMKPSVPNSIIGLSDIKEGSDFVQYYCMRIDLYKDKDVIIAGGGDSAVDFAINIAPISKSVTLIHRRDNLICEAIKLSTLEKLQSSGKLKIELGTQIEAIKESRNNRIVKTNKEEIKVDHVVFCYGFSSNAGGVGGLAELGICFNNNTIDVDINTMETSVENCFAIGDVANYINKKKNIVPCFFEADRAIRTIKKKIS